MTPESLDPEALTLIDPACGSGHILAEAYDLLKAIYLERGYRERDIPELILTKNLSGLDICPRAAQLASFSLLMKGREDDRRLLERGVQPNVMAMQDSAGLCFERLATNVDLAAVGVSRADVRMLSELFAHATTLGSLIQVPQILAEKLPALNRLSEKSSEVLFAVRDLHQLGAMARQAAILSRRYDVVLANPPYMGSKGMTSLVKKFASDQFPDSKNDLFACFVERCLSMARESGRIGIVAPYVWMFIAAYLGLRKKVIGRASLQSLVQLEYNAFEPACIPVATFVLRSRRIHGFLGSFIKLSDFRGHQNQAPRALEAIKNPDCGWFYRTRPDDLEAIPGSPLAFWATQKILRLFSSKRISDVAEAKEGLKTGDNNKFLRLWFEVNRTSEWKEIVKGGSFRKWYGNIEYVVNWKGGGELLRSQDKSSIPNSRYLDREFLTWSNLTSGTFSMRKVDRNILFETKSPGMFCSGVDPSALLGFYNSKVADFLLRMLAPTLDYKIGPVLGLPHIPDAQVHHSDVFVSVAKRDWDMYERSSGFRSFPLLELDSNPKASLQSRYRAWIAGNQEVITEMQRQEGENNRRLIKAFGLEDELTSDVPIEQITLTVNPSYRYGGDLKEEEGWIRFQRDTAAEFLSYAIGCMMGRYSLDQPGLILADSRSSQAAHLASYEAKAGKSLSEVRFKPDPDAIIPVLDGEWFEDDIVARTREFLEATFSESTITENIRFIEESLGKDIRKYFCTEFYKDHLQTYKKRPIYWMVQSPKKGFACLIYLHRYTKDTLNQVLNNYFRPYLQKLEARLAQLGLDQLNDGIPTRERTAARKEAEKITKVLKECQTWEQDALLPLAQQRIELDLDDGVKVNYLKLQDVLATIPGLAAKEG
jgi:hypothetical protein